MNHGSDICHHAVISPPERFALMLCAHQQDRHLTDFITFSLSTFVSSLKLNLTDCLRLYSRALNHQVVGKCFSEFLHDYVQVIYEHQSHTCRRTNYVHVIVEQINSCDCTAGDCDFISSRLDFETDQFSH